MNRKFFTKDRVIGIVSALLLSPIILLAPSSFAVSAAYWTSWGFVAFFGAVLAFGGILILERSERTVIYITEITKKQMKKKRGLIGSALDHVPSGLVAGSWIVSSYTWVGAAIGLLWIASVMIVSTSQNIFYRFDEETQKELIDLTEQVS